VLPLLLAGSATDDQGLCLGFADALVASLGNLQGIDVLPTSSVINLPADTTPSNVASRLGVRFVVNGAIQLSKGQWSLSIQVFDAHLHSTCYARKRDFALDRPPKLKVKSRSRLQSP
jgi:TolB-like protein